jgi:hypothetical protein
MRLLTGWIATIQVNGESSQAIKKAVAADKNQAATATHQVEDALHIYCKDADFGNNNGRLCWRLCAKGKRVIILYANYII